MKCDMKADWAGDTNGRRFPETGLRSGGHDAQGEVQAGSRDASRIRLGWLIERSTRGWGKPTTWGRTRREHVARKGNSCRTLSDWNNVSQPHCGE